MNEKFFSLPKERQQAILNAGYRIFSQNTYKKTPVSEIAASAGISKSLLFYYFRNKRELYLFLWENCVRTTVRYMTAYDCYRQTNLFEMLRNTPIDIEKMEHDFEKMLEFWKHLYLKESEPG